MLNAENVYVTEGDVCKIAGFDTRAALEAEEIENKTSVVSSNSVLLLPDYRLYLRECYRNNH